jgi:zinc transport system permease protein
MSTSPHRIWTFVSLVVGLCIASSAMAEPDSESVERELESIEAELEAESTAETPDAGAPDTGNESIESELNALEREIEASEGNAPDAGDETSGTPTADTTADPTSANPTPEPPPSDVEEGSPNTISAWDLYRDPILCGLFAGAALGLLGVYVVSRRIVFVSAALSQVSALGITIGFFIVGYGGLGGFWHEAIPPLSAIALAFAVVFALVRVQETSSFPRDAVLGVAFVLPMALVLLLGPYIPQEMHEIESILHGSAVVVRPSDLYAVGAASMVVIATQVLGFHGFVFASLDPTVARTRGLPVDTLDAVLFGSIALMTGLVTRALGALPTFALTVLPAIGALRLKIGLTRVFAVASIAGALAGAGGYGVAILWDGSVGASQTIAAAVLAGVLRLVGVGLDRWGRRDRSTSGSFGA